MLYDDVVWGETLCDDCRHKSADGLYLGEPLCIACADNRLERFAAISLNPKLRDLLPPLLDRWTGTGYV